MSGSESRRSAERRFEQAAELACEVDRHAGVDGSLLVEEALRSGHAEHALVPDIRSEEHTSELQSL